MITGLVEVTRDFIIDADDTDSVMTYCGIVDLDTGAYTGEISWANITTGQYLVYDITPDGHQELRLHRGRIAALCMSHCSPIGQECLVTGASRDDLRYEPYQPKTKS